MKRFAYLSPIIGIALLVGQLSSTATAAESPDFEREILPLLYSRCFSCHSEKQLHPKADLRLDSVEGIRDSGVVNMDRPDESEMLIRVSMPHSDERLMPPLK